MANKNMYRDGEPPATGIESMLSEVDDINNVPDPTPEESDTRDPKENKERRTVRIPGGIDKLYADYNHTKSRYSRAHRKVQLLDQIYQGELWKAIGAQFPSYQILPDTNDVAYVTNHMVASIYSVSKSANILPTSEEDVQIVETLNISMEHEWNVSQVPQAQREAGHNAALFNLGITQFGWDEGLTSNLILSHGGVKVRDVHPLKFMRDPFAPNFEEAAYCYTTDRFHSTYFLSSDIYRKPFQAHLDATPTQNKYGTVLPNQWTPTDTVRPQQFPGSSPQGDDYHTLVIAWYKVNTPQGVQIDEYHTLNGSFLLHAKHNIQPNLFPFALLYCNNPMGDLIGNSEPARIVANSIVCNIMDSENLTNAYRKMHPPKFINSQSQLNINSFAKHANDPDYTFVVSGDASKALHYAEFPQIDQNGLNIQSRLQESIKRVSGVDDKYTGRNTGSITTTGGMQEMIDRMTLIDVPRIDRFENYSKKATEIVLRNLIYFAPKRKYLKNKASNNLKTSSWVVQEIDFPALHKQAKDAVFSYQIHISSDLPKNRQRNADLANQLMEQQMQYQQQGVNVELITPEEWLRYQDLPNKEMMLERMGLQRQQSALEDTSQVLFQYAQLTSQGMSPEDAMLAVANDLNARRQGQPMGQPDQLAQMGISTGDPTAFPNQFGMDPAAMAMQSAEQFPQSMPGAPPGMSPEGLPEGLDPAMLASLMGGADEEMF